MKIMFMGGVALTAALALAACGKKPAADAAAPATAGAAAATTGTPAAASGVAPPATITAATPELRAAGSAVEAVVRSAYAAASAGAVDPGIFVDETGKAFAAAPGKITGDWRFDGSTGPTTAPTFYGVNMDSPTTAHVNAEYKLNGEDAYTNWDLCKVGDQWKVRDVNSRHMYTVRQSLGLVLTGGC